ncbi:MAG: radical SAM protein [Desulfuromonadales bacterium]|nr:radical SAM protein [Desulfuromonadales bacterium]
MHILIATLHVRPSAQAVPLAAGCIKACLPPELQRRTELVDLFPDLDTASLSRKLLDLNPTIIAFPLYVWNRTQVLSLTRLLQRQRPELILLAGGPEASADSQKVINEGALAGIIRGEGEVSFAELIADLSANKTTSGLSGYLPAKPESQILPAAAVCSDLSLLPSPWLTGQLPLTENCGVLWEVARGCQFNCAFCYDAKGHQGVRPFPTERLQQELKLFAKHRVGQIWILDSTFNAPPKRGKQLLRMLLELAPQIHYHIEAKADFLDSDTINLLSQLSCSVQIGLQSATAAVLAPLHRNLQLQQMEQHLQQMSRAGITFGLDLIYGLPGDNHAGFCNSLDFTLRQQPNQVDVFPLAVLPGTELFDKQREFGIRGESQPPYLLQTNQSYSAADLQKSRLLAAATDIFYNRGRAVGFFIQLCNALKLLPSVFLQQFGDWLVTEKKIGLEEIMAVDNWQPDAILPLQQQFVAQQLKAKKISKLLAIATDLINFHFFCATTLLADDCCSDSRRPGQKQRWKLNPAVAIQGFNYSLDELEMVGGESLAKICRQLEPEPGHAIFLRQQGEVIIEALDDDFAALLGRAKTAKTRQQLGHGLAPELATELLDFAIAQGLLLPVT